VLEKVEVGVSVPFETIISEFFASGDIDEITKSLKDLNVPNSHSQFVKKVLVLAIEKHPYERELVSKLLSALYGNLLSMTDISDGFLMALRALPDIVLDSPDAHEVLGKFLARAIFDEIVAPVFLRDTVADLGDASDVPSAVGTAADQSGLSRLGLNSIELATALVNDDHRSARLPYIWGPGDMHSVKRLKEEVELLLREYVVTADQKEASRCLRALSVPTFHFQVVKHAVRMSLVLTDQKERQRVVDLLVHWHREGLVSGDHISQGFKLCYETLNDIKCDVPAAPSLLVDLTQQCKQHHILPQDATFALPASPSPSHSATPNTNPAPSS